MKLIDADKFLGYLIFSKHIDSLKCKEVKEAVEMCKVDVLEQIRNEIIEESLKKTTMERTVGMLEAVRIIDKNTKGNIKND